MTKADRRQQQLSEATFRFILSPNYTQQLKWTAPITNRLLVEAGANMNIADKEGVTPLTHARRRGFTQMVRVLEARGAR